MALPEAVAKLFRMDDESWRRHANPLSVFTRLAAIPVAALAIWSRTWIGWWAVLPCLAVIVWLFANTRVFAPVTSESSWAARGIFGEKMWLEQRGELLADHRAVLARLVWLGAGGALLMVWGLYWLELWPTLMGMALLILGQLWRIDRMGLAYRYRTAP